MPHELYCRDYGSENSSPFLMLHGLGTSGSSWDAVARLLAQDHRVLVPDLLGFGDSPRPDVAYTVAEHLEALITVVEERTAPDARLNIVGHSMGSILAVELAARILPRVGSLTLVSFPYFKSPEEVHALTARFGWLTRMTISGHWSAALACGIMCHTRPLLQLVSPLLVRRIPPAIVRAAFQHNFVSYSGSLQNVVVNHRTDQALSQLALLPVLLVTGEADQVAPLVNVERLLQNYPNWRLEAVGDADHYLPFMMPGLLGDILKGQAL